MEEVESSQTVTKSTLDGLINYIFISVCERSAKPPSQIETGQWSKIDNEVKFFKYLEMTLRYVKIPKLFRLGLGDLSIKFCFIF